MFPGLATITFSGTGDKEEGRKILSRAGISHNMTKNPNWARDELILALDLYMRVDPNRTSKKNPEIIALSDTLNSLPIHPRGDHQENFRNPNGVYMKLCNFLRFDPEYKGAGLQAGGKHEESIWEEFANDPERLTATAAAIRTGATLIEPPSENEEFQVDDEDGFPEGRILTQLHKRRERSPTAVRKKKQSVLKATGKLACEVCGFDFEEAYGELGRGFAECHHRKPLSELPASKATRLKDLAIVCANCHRMLHRARSWRTVEELMEQVNQRIVIDGPVQ